MTSSALKFDNISKTFGGVPAVKDVSFQLDAGRVICLIGENGAGKSTLMNILGGVLPADAGRMQVHGRSYQPRTPADAVDAGIAFIHQELNLFTNLTVAENLFINKFPLRASWIPLIKKRAIHTAAKEIVEKVGLSASPDTKVEVLSPGERQLVEIGKAINTNAQIIILDEPTSSLTHREKGILFELLFQMRDEGRSLIYITHVLDDVARLADDVTVLRDGSVTDCGRAADFTTERMISSMVGRSLEQLYPAREANVSEHVVLEAKGITQPGIVKDVNLVLNRGEILGLFGLMGAGRTELARILFGLDPHEQGVISVDGEEIIHSGPAERIANGMAFVTEDRREEGLLLDSSIAENLNLVSLRKHASPVFKIVDGDGLASSAKHYGETLGIKTAGKNFEQEARNLSGGNQQKAVIGKWISNDPKILIMDEPTRGIDVGAKYDIFVIINRLVADGASVLYISSEIEELIGVCDRIAVMRNGEVVRTSRKEEFERGNLIAAAFGQD